MKYNCGKYQLRFNLLVSQLLLMDAKQAGEFSATLVSGITGCTERHARRMIKQWVNSQRRNNV